jgi:hypothetical protein
MGETTRRRFNQTAFAGGMAIAGASSIAPVRGENARRWRIAFVDYDLNNYHADTFLGIVRGPLRERGFDVVAAAALKDPESRRWARKNDVRYVERIDQLADLADCFIVLAPDNSEVRMELCAEVFPLARPTFVDKTFAPDHAAARQLFDLANQHQTPLQSSSALRYTNVQAEAASRPDEPLIHMTAWGGGVNFKDRAVHPLEMLISCMGHKATHVMREGDERRTTLFVRFTGGRAGLAHVFTGAETPYAASLTTAKRTRYVAVKMDEIYANLMTAVLDFFASGQPAIDPRQTLAIMRLIDAGLDPRTDNQFMALDGSTID